MRKKNKPERLLLLFFLLFVIAFSGCIRKERSVKIGILQWTEKIEPFNETCRGFIEGLEESGYVEDKNLKIFYKNAEQDTDAAHAALREFVKKQVDVIVALGTGSAVASFITSGKNKIPVVYSILGHTKAIERMESYNSVKHLVTGVTMKVPMGQKFGYLKEILPDMNSIGILYCNQTPEAVTTGERAFETVQQMGLTPVRRVVDIEEISRLKEITCGLLSEADVLYIPTDPVLGIPENFSVIVNAADVLKKPVISVSNASVMKGALFAMHTDFYYLGKQTTYPVIKILEGISPSKIQTQDPAVINTSLNLKKAELLGLKISRNILAKTDNFIQ